MQPRRINIATDPNEPGRKVARRRSRKGSRRRDAHARSALRHPLALLAVAVVTGYALLGIGLNLLVDTEAVRGWIAPRASDALNRPVSVGGARVALLPRPSIHVMDVRVDNLAGFDGPALASAERVRLDVRWLPLLIGRVSVDALRIDGPRVYMAIDEQGTSNFGDLIPERGEPVETPAAPVALTVAHVEVFDGSLTFFDAPTARSVTISGADAELRLAPEGAAGWRADVAADADSLLTRIASVTEILRLEGPSVTLTARSDGTGRSVDVSDGAIELSGETLGLSGRVSGLLASPRSYDLQLTNDSLDARVLAVAFPEPTRSRLLPAFDGELGVTLQVTSARASGQRPVVRGSLHLSDVSVRMSGQNVVDGVDGTVGVTPDSLVLDSIEGTFADGPFELSGTLARGTRTFAVKTRAEPDLDALDRLGLVPEEVTLSGAARVDVALDGRLDALDSARVDGTVGLSGVQAKLASLAAPLYFPAGEIALLGHEVRWSDLTVLLGEDPLTTTGRLVDVTLIPSDADARTPRMDASVTGPRLDLGALLPPRALETDLTYSRLAFAHLGARRVDGRPASVLVSELDLSRPRTTRLLGTVTLDVDTLDYRGYRLESVSARVEASDSSLTVEAPHLVVWGGTASASLTLALGDRPGEPFGLGLQVDTVSAVDFLSALTPVEQSVTGTLSLELTLDGTLDAELMPTAEDLSGRARLSILDGRVYGTGPNLVVADFLGSDEWRDISFESWDSELEIAERRIDVTSSRLTGEQADVALSGLVHLTGSHDLSVGVSIPPGRLQTVSLRRTGIGQSVLEHLSEAGSSLDLGLRMSGELRDPVVEPDASSALASSR